MSLYLQFQSFLRTPRRSCRSSSSSFSSWVAASSSPWLAPSSSAGGSAGSEDTEVSFGIHYGDVIMGTIASQITSLHDCLLSRLFRRRSKKTSKLRVTGLGAGNSPGTGEFPAQRTSNAENVDDVIMRNAKHLRCIKIANLQRNWLFL